MIQRITTTVLILLISMQLFASFVTDSIITSKPKPVSKNYEFSIMPLSLIDFFKPHFRVGFEYSQKHSGYLVELGLGSDIYNQRNEFGMYEIRLQARHYIPSSVISDFYFGLEAFANNATYIYDGGFLLKDYYVRADNIHKQKFKAGLNIIVGQKIYAFRRVSFDIYTGIGYSLLRMKILSFNNANAYLHYFNDFEFPREPGLYGLINFAFGIRVNYLLKSVEFAVKEK